MNPAAPVTRVRIISNLQFDDEVWTESPGPARRTGSTFLQAFVVRFAWSAFDLISSEPVRRSRRAVTWSSVHRTRRRGLWARHVEFGPRSDGVKHRGHVGGPPDVVVWLGGAPAPQVDSMVQPRQ
jgi:hypothetical protein